MKNAGIEGLRFLAAVGIVGCHLALKPCSTFSCWLLHYTDVSVGVFGAISGYFLARSFLVNEHGLSPQRMIGKRIVRILPLYLVWTLVYLTASPLFDIVLKGGALNDKYFHPAFWFSVCFNGGAACHLWYLVHLLYASIVLVFLWSASKKIFCNIYLLMFLSLSALMLSVFCEGNWFFYGIRLFAFVTLGSSIYMKKDLLHISWKIWGIVALVMAIVHFEIPLRPAFIQDYLLVIPLFMFAVTFHSRHGEILRMLGEMSLGIYLVHPLLTAGGAVAIKKIFHSPYGLLPISLDWLMAVGLATFLTCCLRRLPFLSRLVK